MEIKKSKKADLNKMRNTNFLLGLIVALALIFWIFEWTTFRMKAKTEDFKVEYDLSDEEIVPVTMPIIQTAPTPPADVPPVAEIIEIVKNEVEIEQTETKVEESAQISSSQGGEYSSSVVTTSGSGGGEGPPPPPPPPAEKTDEDKIYEVAEVMPEFPGGMDALMKYLTKNIKYPSRAQENGIQGTVVCKFVVGKDGEISSVKVAKALDPECDKEAVRVIKSMPKWKPAKQNGKPVNCQFSVPVRFHLQ